MEPNEEMVLLQADEINALEAIYSGKLTRDSDNSFSIEISNGPGRDVFLQVTFPEFYPLQSPPIYKLSAPWMSRKSKLKLLSKLEKQCSEYLGQSIVYMLIQTINDFVKLYKDVKKSEAKACKTTDITDEVELPVIEHGKTVVDRKSVFQGHIARITSEKQIPLVLAKLKENGKINSAKHNTYAYRILRSDGLYNEGFDDDGEKKAGSLLLHTLQLVNLSNILVIVTRWFGGIQIGSDRFKHYTNAATTLFKDLKLVQSGISSDMEKVILKDNQ